MTSTSPRTATTAQGAGRIHAGGLDLEVPSHLEGEINDLIHRNNLPATEVGQVVKFFDVVVRYEIALWNAVDGELARHGLIGLGQLHALRVVDRYAGRARVQELSGDIGITVGAASKLADRLERDGLVARRPNPANRRSSLITLTPTGQQALAAGLEVAQATVHRAVGEEDVELVTAALERLQARLDGLSTRTAA